MTVLRGSWASSSLVPGEKSSVLFGRHSQYLARSRRHRPNGANLRRHSVSDEAATFNVAVIVLLAWGVLAFGAVYPWAYWPLLVGAAFIGLEGLGLTRVKNHLPEASEGSAVIGSVDRSVPLGVIIGLVAVSLGIIAQLVPLPTHALSFLSPATVTLLNEFSVLFARGVVTAHPLSIHPEATAVALTFLTVLTLLVAGLTRAFSVTGIRAVAAGISILGVVVALTAIVQQATINTGRIYGFWTPEAGSSFYGPFVNKNHFAGWMIMAMSVALGCFAGRLARAMRDVEGDWRKKLLWLSSPAASQLILVAGAVLVMGVSLLMSLSRSGVICSLLAFVLMARLIIRKQHGKTRKATGLSYLAAAVVAIAGWIGTEAIAQRFAGAPWIGMEGRGGAWVDGLEVVQDFWATGTGMNTYGDAMLLYQRHQPHLHYVQAHNDYLQIAAEGGLLVGLPAVITIGLFVTYVRRRLREDRPDSMSYWVRAGACVGLLAIGLQETVEFSLQMPGNAAMFATLTAIALHRAPRTSGRRRGKSAIGAAFIS